jgi:Tfp pilus assembly PilM family ATPase
MRCQSPNPPYNKQNARIDYIVARPRQREIDRERVGVVAARREREKERG